MHAAYMVLAKTRRSLNIKKKKQYIGYVVQTVSRRDFLAEDLSEWI